MATETTIRLPNGFECAATVTYKNGWSRITPETPLRAGEGQGEPDLICDHEERGEKSVAYMKRAIVDAWKRVTGWTNAAERSGEPTGRIGRDGPAARSAASIRSGVRGGDHE